MNHLSLRLGLPLLALLVLTGCGSTGVPLPPSLELARPVSDLRAVRKGNTVYLTWSAPEATTDRHNIRHPGPTDICRSVASTMHECVAVGRSPYTRPPDATKTASKTQVTYSDQLPADVFSKDPTALLVYAV